MNKLSNNIQDCLQKVVRIIKIIQKGNSALPEGLDEEFVTLIKKHELIWSTTHTDKLPILSDQLFKIIQKK